MIIWALLGMFLIKGRLIDAIAQDTPMQNGQPMAVTPLGTFLGRSFTTTRQGRTVYAFTGIPYALPPVGDLRFRVSISNISLIVNSFLYYAK